MDISNIQAVSGYIIKPLWNNFKTKGGVIIDIGYEFGDSMPARNWAVQGEVISAKPKHDAQKGDTIYFTWNALSFAYGCISHPRQDNLFCLKHSYYAYEHKGVFHSILENEYGTDDFGYLLLEPIEEKVEEKVTESGIVLSGFRVQGSVLDAEVVENKTKKKLHGKIEILPRVLPYDTIWNPQTQENDKIEVGLNVVCENTSDVPVEIHGKSYYRTRFSEIIYSYHD